GQTQLTLRLIPWRQRCTTLRRRSAVKIWDSHTCLSQHHRCLEVELRATARIAAAMTAFAAGDALGVPWEGSPPGSIGRDRMLDVPQAPWGWPRGTTSDDTAQMMLVARLLVDSGGEPTAAEFVGQLASAREEIRGLGPTTRRALDGFAATG